MDIVASVKNLQLPLSEIIVIGSGIMGVLGLKECNDIDLLISPAVKETLRSRGWKSSIRQHSDRTSEWMENPPFEASDTFWQNTTLAYYLSDPTRFQVVEGVQFLSLSEVLRMKKAWSRPKDIPDIKLIEAYLASH